METLFQFLELIGPVVAAALTVPILGAMKNFSRHLDNMPAMGKQVSATAIAFGLTEIGSALNTAIPTDIHLFSGDSAHALAAAGIAMAIHAGKKASGVSQNKVKMLSLIALFMMPTVAACQTGRATVTVIDRSRLVVIVDPPTYTGEVGDTLTFSAVAVDSISGDTIPAVFRWQSTDPSGVSIDETTGLATLLQAGTYDIEAMVQRIVAMQVIRQNDDATWSAVRMSGPYWDSVYAAQGSAPDLFTLQVDDMSRLCAYLVSDQDQIFLPDSVEWSSADPSIVTVESTTDQEICPEWSPGLGWVSRAMRIPAMPWVRQASRG